MTTPPVHPTFHITGQSGTSRTGRITTAHGVLETPAFLFCATHATLKGLSIDSIKAAGTPILLSNTYHLMLQPGSDLIEQLGGIHTFMGWDGPVFTDSGGYQIFSLHHGSVSDEIKGKRRNMSSFPPVKVTEEGAIFVSHRDGKRHHLTPEKSIQVQTELGADLICVLDECTPLHMTRAQTERSMHLSHRWGKRSLDDFEQRKKPHQGLYGIVQGGIYPDFRKHSAEMIASMPFFGHAIGGSLGATKSQMGEVIDMALCDGALYVRPIHLLGIGGVEDIFQGVSKGIDTFDCVSPTRLGRHGGALIDNAYWDDAAEDWRPKNHINLWKSCFRTDPKPIDASCPCSTCALYSRAYLHHLLKAKEILALTALSVHNVCFMNRLMAAIRHGIATHSLGDVRNRWSCAALMASGPGMS
ncbi:MAG: tRNA guanosine(34) transglycosylase Tgt [Alphaproteobacteria bacterium]|nr:tRNA guanosine(34) transglycosylase Tgt [Alphaproteobacteria bacterium]